MTLEPGRESGAPGVDLTARGLRKAFEGGLVVAVEHAELTVRAGERVAIVGPTGCGKSTLLALLGLLERPDAGTITIDGADASAFGSAEAWRAANVGIVFQLHHLLPHLTAAENVQLPLAAAEWSEAAQRERARELLTALGLADRATTLAARLSGGERQLAALARAMANRPRLLLADEPTGALDSASGRRLLDRLLGDDGERHTTVVLVTHDMEVATRADRVVAMRDGRLRG